MENHQNHQPSCPDCGSQHIELDESDTVIGLAAFFILGYPQGLAPMMKHTVPLLCLDCGHRWDQQRDLNQK